ncbi:MAG: glycosyltransferase family 4 protein [Planctomycetota bacterium]|jgi:UDP-GlcNAc:undecaprenyl-phosphate GlcNAc-1-phosphate transferase
MNPGIYVYLGFAGAVAVLLLVPAFKYFSIRLGIMDMPRPGRIHSKPTPLLGGPAIFLALLGVIGGHYLAGQILARGDLLKEWFSPGAIARMRYAVGAFPRLAAIFVGALAMLVVGVADDVRSLPAWLRLGLEFAVAAVVVGLGVRPELYILPRWLVYVVAVVWIVGITNSFNLIDSMDGLAAGVAAVSAALFGFWAALSNQPMVAMMLASFTGVMVGFLFFNSSPASIFLGSGGSMVIGYFLAVTVLVSTFMTGSGGGLLPVVMPLIILGVPLYDTASVVAIRLYRRRSPFSPDLNHLAHRIYRLGLSRRQTVLFVYLLTFAVGLGAVTLSDCSEVHQSLKSWIVLMQVLALFAILVVLEWVSFGVRRANLTTPVPAELTLYMEGPEPLVGKLLQLGMSAAEMEVDGLQPAAAARALDERAGGSLLMRFGEPFAETRVGVSVRGVRHSQSGTLVFSLGFGPLSGEARSNLEFALAHYRALGEN